MPSINGINSFDMFRTLNAPQQTPPQAVQAKPAAASSNVNPYVNPYVQNNNSYDDNSYNRVVTSYEEQPPSPATNKEMLMQNGATEKVANAVDAAIGEIGTSEATGNNDGEILKYGGKEGDAWCASFASWSYGGLEDNSDTFGYQIGVYELAQEGKKAGYYSDVSEYEPIPGDIMIQQSNGASHTGLVVGSDENYIYTVEGNAGDAVRAKKYAKDGESIQKNSGYIRMNEWTGGESISPDPTYLTKIEFEDADADKEQSTR